MNDKVIEQEKDIHVQIEFKLINKSTIDEKEYLSIIERINKRLELGVHEKEMECYGDYELQYFIRRGDRYSIDYLKEKILNSKHPDLY